MDQGDYKNLQGRSAILDCVAYDTDGRQYNIEIQQDFEGLPESYVIYVNASIQDDTELGRLMHDFHCKDAKNMYGEILAKRVRELKETQEGVEQMCREERELMEEFYNEGEKRGIEIGMRTGELMTKKENAMSFSKLGIPVEQIAQGLNVGVAMVEQWIAEGAAAEK